MRSIITLTLALGACVEPTQAIYVGGSTDEVAETDTGAFTDTAEIDTGVELEDTGDSASAEDSGDTDETDSGSDVDTGEEVESGTEDEEIVDTAETEAVEEKDEESDEDTSDFDPADVDNDGDGFAESDFYADCDDDRDDVNPGEVETCDGIDNDCDGSVDEGTACAEPEETEPEEEMVETDTAAEVEDTADTGGEIEAAIFDTGTPLEVEEDTGEVDTAEEVVEEEVDTGEPIDTAEVEEVVETVEEEEAMIDEDGDGFVEVCWSFPDGFYGGELNIWGSGAYSVIIQVPLGTTVMTSICGMSPWALASGDEAIIQGLYYTTTSTSSKVYIARNIGESATAGVYDFDVFGTLTFDGLTPDEWEAVSYDADLDGSATGAYDGAYGYTIVP